MQFNRENSSQCVEAELFIRWQEPGCLDSPDVRRTQCKLPHDVVFIWQQGQPWKPVVSFHPSEKAVGSGFILTCLSNYQWIPCQSLRILQKTGSAPGKMLYSLSLILQMFIKCQMLGCMLERKR